MLKYFTTCKTAEELKAEYKRLARELHPDCNPGKDTTAEFQNMQKDFEAAWKRLKDVHVNADGETYHKETTESAREYMEIINTLLKVPGIVIEVCGSWLWVTGNTYPARDMIKSLGFKWSKKKAAWYFHSEPYFKRSRKTLSLEEIRNYYGSEAFKSADPEMLTA